ncbi:DUF4065 domain-containing protein [Aphanizomenon sp. CS-733/32]|uniref:Panacea domain-containing protein n=1 Tax=Aphanizomenon sp. CS-733/32 TaxID=3021715 RepID=UPI00232F39E2|nr:type II toxin-antitoxin system antitoxin SocA domain-containing protein [Aphanizomenon sp. CS-733/32]MDB9308928.1 DUF4065 domain-containing protein [Aphanizomenon sp. CS-733/32]
MKSQKLLYYAQSLHLAMYDEPLFPEEIQAWRYGPVCPPAYRSGGCGMWVRNNSTLISTERLSFSSFSSSSFVFFVPSWFISY